MTALLLRQDRPAALASGVGLAGLVLCAAGLAFDPRALLAGWLTAALLIVGLPLGAMTVLMIHGLTGGRWGQALTPPLRAMVSTLPLALLFLLPVLLGLHLVFPWASGDAAAPTGGKLAYLDARFFAARAFGCAAVWLGLAWFLLARTGPRERKRQSARGFALGLLLHGLAVSVFSTDWMLSLDMEFASTVYAMIEASAEAAGAAALALVVLAVSRNVQAVPGGDEEPALGEDVANMLFGFVLIWAYLSYMQWLVAWAGDLPHDIGWYLLRAADGWRALLWLLVALHVVPIAGFLVRAVKRSRPGLLALGLAVLAGHVADVAWRVRPPLAARGAAVSWPDLAAVAAAGGLWAAAFLLALRCPGFPALLRRRPAHG